MQLAALVGPTTSSSSNNKADTANDIVVVDDDNDEVWQFVYKAGFTFSKQISYPSAEPKDYSTTVLLLLVLVVTSRRSGLGHLGHRRRIGLEPHLVAHSLTRLALLCICPLFNSYARIRIALVC
jgi:hypothetical protein